MDSFDQRLANQSFACHATMSVFRLILLSYIPASRVGHLRFTFESTAAPYVLVEATRASVMGSNDPTNVTYPLGDITIDPARREISGRNPERQDFIIGPSPAPSFAGYFVARFNIPFASYGTAQNGSISENATSGKGALLSGYARFPEGTHQVDVRVGVSFISVEQARKNLDTEIPDGTSLEKTAETTRAAWAEKLDRVKVEGATDEESEIFYTAVFHTLQVCRRHELEEADWTLSSLTSTRTSKAKTENTTQDMMTLCMKANRTLATPSGYVDPCQRCDNSLTPPLQDTFRAEWAWQILLVPERISGMVQSMLQDYTEVRELPVHQPYIHMELTSIIGWMAAYVEEHRW